MYKLLNLAFLERKVVSRLTSIPKCWLLKCSIENLHWLWSWVYTKDIEKRSVVLSYVLPLGSINCCGSINPLLLHMKLAANISTQHPDF